MSGARQVLDQLDAAHGAGTADGEWRAVDNGTRHSPEYRYEILDDEGSVAVCSDDNDATATTGAQRTALIVAAVNALPGLTAALRAVLDLRQELVEDSRIAKRLADEARARDDREMQRINIRHARVAHHAASALDAALAALGVPDTSKGGEG